MYVCYSCILDIYVVIVVKMIIIMMMMLVARDDEDSINIISNLLK